MCNIVRRQPFDRNDHACPWWMSCAANFWFVTKTRRLSLGSDDDMAYKCATVALHAGRYFAETSYFHSFGRKPNLALLTFAVLSRISRDLNFGRDNTNAAKQAASQGAKHRNASWINPSVYPYIAAVSGCGFWSIQCHSACCWRSWPRQGSRHQQFGSEGGRYLSGEPFTKGNHRGKMSSLYDRTVFAATYGCQYWSRCSRQCQDC